MPIESSALVGDGRGQATLVTTLIDDPQGMEVRVRIRASGICHTDLDGISLESSAYVLGHEGAGEVVDVGPDVHDLQPGARVLLTWAIACGRCFYCVRGHPVLCETLGLEAGGAHRGATRQSGRPIRRSFQLGTMSTFAIVRREALVPLPDSISFEHAALLGCGVMTGYGSVVNAAKLEPGSTATVIGCGGVGLNAIQGARIAGASAVVAVDVDQEKLDLARRFGATHIVLASATDSGLLLAADRVRSMFSGRGTDYSFECTAKPALAFSPLAFIHNGGTAVQVSGVEQVVPADVSLFEWNKRYVNPLYGDCRPSVDFPRLFALYERGALLLEPLIARRYTLADYANAFRTAKHSPAGKGVFVHD